VLTIVIAAGGTAGHVVPALAVADALRAEGADVTFVGAGRAESELVPAAGYELHEIPVEGLSRTSPLRAARALVLAALAVPRARKLLKRLRADAVMGGGGYVAGPTALAALTLRIPIVLTEADSHIGLSNRLLAPFAARVCLAFPPEIERDDEDVRDGSSHSRRLPVHLPRRLRSRRRRRGARYLVTGRPIPPPARDADGARERIGIEAGETCVLVFGGSLGARSINLAAVEALSGSAFRVLHVAGRRDYAELRARELPAGYDLREYLGLADFADALATADLAVARAGGSVFEIAAHGVPAILVPYPHAAGDHQSANARWMSSAGAAIVIPDDELTGPRLAHEVAALLGDRPTLDAMAAASRRLARPDAARAIAAELLEVARR
jgi:UDP-N-acetylglucosamine--N-acetylmuramyl-(pentapeptide) pyrophosphoryl-undecaprenol N-acetylglucosamine transferase